jgi:hypothetical protein
VWVKLDDRFPTNPKVEGLSAKAFRAYVEGLCHCGLHLTDGEIIGAAARRLAGPRFAAELVAAGLWLHDEASGAYWVNDYLAFQPSRSQVEEDRRRKAEAGRRGGLAKAANRLADA